MRPRSSTSVARTYGIYRENLSTISLPIVFSLISQEPEKLVSHLAGILPAGGELVICHSESRDKINGHHDKHAGKLSEGLPPVEELARMLSPFFHCQHDGRQ